MNVDVANKIGLSCGCYTFHEATCQYPDYTADDLLVWLSGRGWATTADYLIGHETPALVTLRSNSASFTLSPPMCPTLLEALEAAVLAVSS